ncbi:MAG: hypothetical protein AAGG44_09200, partial [Planctomycetota bacterium]
LQRKPDGIDEVTDDVIELPLGPVVLENGRIAGEFGCGADFETWCSSAFSDQDVKQSPRNKVEKR